MACHKQCADWRDVATCRQHCIHPRYEAPRKRTPCADTRPDRRHRRDDDGSMGHITCNQHALVRRAGANRGGPCSTRRGPYCARCITGPGHARSRNTLAASATSTGAPCSRDDQGTGVAHNRDESRHDRTRPGTEPAWHDHNGEGSIKPTRRTQKYHAKSRYPVGNDSGKTSVRSASEASPMVRRRHTPARAHGSHHASPQNRKSGEVSRQRTDRHHRRAITVQHRLASN